MTARDQIYFQSHKLTKNKRKGLNNLNLKKIIYFSSSVQGSTTCTHTVRVVLSYTVRECTCRWWGIW